MGLTIPAKEMELANRMARSAYKTGGLTNDLYSWEKELAVSKANGESHVVNAIWVLMQEHSCSVEAATLLLREKIKECVSDFVRIAKEVEGNLELSIDTRKYIASALYGISGNFHWSLQCPRYRPNPLKRGTPQRHDTAATGGNPIAEGDADRTSTSEDKPESSSTLNEVIQDERASKRPKFECNGNLDNKPANGINRNRSAAIEDGAEIFLAEGFPALHDEVSNSAE